MGISWAVPAAAIASDGKRPDQRLSPYSQSAVRGICQDSGINVLWALVWEKGDCVVSIGEELFVCIWSRSWGWGWFQVIAFKSGLLLLRIRLGWVDVVAGAGVGWVELVGLFSDIPGLRGTTYPEELTGGKPSMDSGIPKSAM